MHDSWLQTYTGVQFYPFRATPEMINIEDIAHQLAYQTRYRGALEDYYSIAEHCVLGSQVIDPNYALEFLLHDAEEAYLGDMSAPIKRFMPDFARLGDEIRDVIFNKYGLTAGVSEAVHQLDLAICITEKTDGFADSLDWGWENTVDKLELVPQYWSPQESEDLFLSRFEELTS